MKKLESSVDRDVNAVPCPCGGYSDRVKTTAEEKKEFGCARDQQFDWECCVRAFVCRICKERLAGRALAPEMD